MLEYLPHINASLNLVATCLLVTGYVLIKRKREETHKRAMLSAFAVSTIFLACYLYYHRYAGSHPFPRADYAPIFSWLYFLILVPHIILAAFVPFLGIATIYFGLAEKREKHRRLAKITFPIWLYVSITGVLVYLFLYWWFPPLTEVVSGAG